MKYALLRLTDCPERKTAAAQWFHAAWGVPLEAYPESMGTCLRGTSPVPQWYLASEHETGKILGGMGVIENDFHDRKDLTPNVCAVYVEPESRGQGIAGALLAFVCRDMQARGVDTLYLLTDHTGFYARYGWKFFCLAQGTGAPPRQECTSTAHSPTAKRNTAPHA